MSAFSDQCLGLPSFRRFCAFRIARYDASILRFTKLRSKRTFLVWPLPT